MTTKTIREQAKERLQQRADRQAQIDQRAAEVVAHVLRIELIHAPDVEVEAEFLDAVGRLDTFRVQVVASGVAVEGVIPYRVHPRRGMSQQVELSVEKDCYGDAPTQAWRCMRNGKQFDDVIDAIIDATEWTLEDLS